MDEKQLAALLSGGEATIRNQDFTNYDRETQAMTSTRLSRSLRWK